MIGEPFAGSILPQASHMQSFSFAPQTTGPTENQKNYVFVDEHNRHKRLKVMRACEGCRRRKIKCDAATTNTWPCSACTRLKLNCVPPTVNHDREFATNPPASQPERGGYDSGGDDDYHQQVPMLHHSNERPRNPPPFNTQQLSFNEPVGVYQPVAYAESPSHGQQLQYNNFQPSMGMLDHQHYSHQSIYANTTLIHQSPNTSTPEVYSQDQYTPEDLADLMGELKMAPSGTAPYLNSKNKKMQQEEPAFEELDEYSSVLPPVLSGPDLKVRIPPELMPDEETCLQYFDIYFMNTHPYVPVLNKSAFYQQWHTNRESISPLILEAIFAIAGRLSDEPSQGHQWLSLVSKHADSFQDTPRLSTLQATLIVLKARESAPKRGYYYRSWMTVVQCVQMAKDLGLDEHFEDHQAGKSCGSDLADCITKTRIWQTIFICELMIGSPQGRTDLSVDMDSLDMSIPQTPIGGDDMEFDITRNFTYFTRVVRNVREMNEVYAKIKKKKEWGIDPELVQLNPSFESWMKDLPNDLQVSFATDGSPPWLPSHFIGNLHSYYYLSIIMLHRPQLTFMDPNGSDGGWKHHMMVCYSSAKLLCRLQEGILQAYGLTGLLCMQRGINFTIYCILTCTVLHLVALTSPDPDLNMDAREYFTRHMRILERCSSSWPMPDMQQQIDALREAFSADTRRPFVLKSSFPYGSPRSLQSITPPRSNPQYLQTSTQGVQQRNAHQPVNYKNYPVSSPSSAGTMDNTYSSPDSSQIATPPRSTTYYLQTNGQGIQYSNVQQPVSYINHPVSSPISAGISDTEGVSPDVQLVFTTNCQPGIQPITSRTSVPEAPVWNPSRIFDQWNTTFGTPSAQSVAPPQSQPQSQAPGNPLKIPSSGAQEIPAQLPITTVAVNPRSIPPQQYSGAAISSSFISPSMWQESVASVYEGGLKRQWDYDENMMPAKRAR